MTIFSIFGYNGYTSNNIWYNEQTYASTVISHASRKRLQIYLLVLSHVYYRALELTVKQPTKSKIKIGTSV